MSGWIESLEAPDYHALAAERSAALRAATKTLGAKPWTTALSVPKPDFLIPNFLQKKAIHVISSPKGCYKTWLGLSTMLSGIYGTPVLGESPTQKFSTLYVAADSTDWDIGEQLRKLLRAHDLKADSAPESFILPFGVQFTNQDHVKLLADLISAYDIDHMVIDVKLYTQGNLDENSDAEQMLYFRVMKHFRDKLGTAITLLHHFGKTTGTPRGAGTVEQAAEHCYELYRGKHSVKLRRSKIRGEASWQEREFTLTEAGLDGRLLTLIEAPAPKAVVPPKAKAADFRQFILDELEVQPRTRAFLRQITQLDPKDLDNTLQALRKADLVRTDGKGMWSIIRIYDGGGGGN